MPRSRGNAGARAPTRPTAAPAARPAAPAKQQQRPMTTAAPTPAAPQPQAQSGGSGLFGQMASTAAGVAVGSSIGHAIGGFFGGGSAAPVEAQPVQAQQSSYDQQNGAGRCDIDAKNFTQCLDQNNGNMQICGWYLDQLKACQAAASQY